MSVQLEAALAEARASAPTRVVILDMLALYHPSFINEAGDPSPLFIVNNNEDIVATLEATAPQFGGQAVNFMALGFRPSRPELSAGSVPIFSLDIDNVGDEVSDQIERSQLVEPRQPILCTHRQYLSDNLTGPCYISPYLQALTDIAISPSKITARARVTDSANINFLRSVYTLKQFPALIV